MYDDTRWEKMNQNLGYKLGMGVVRGWTRLVDNCANWGVGMSHSSGHQMQIVGLDHDTSQVMVVNTTVSLVVIVERR